jgi:hypothetical protein
MLESLEAVGLSDRDREAVLEETHCVCSASAPPIRSSLAREESPRGKSFWLTPAFIKGDAGI